ncbi:ligand-binding sensor domain-containing protein [Enhygromyxa salina]|nr:two-component regulator propeller domain-containing protein [Enhygromyxa salina]
MALCLLPLCVGSCACAAAEPEKHDVRSSQPDVASTAQVVPSELSQYPGAPYEDHKGRLWFTTVLSGLVMYDGEAFVRFTPEDGLGGDSVRSIAEDDEGVLWFGTTGGVSRYDGESFITLTDYGDTPVTHTFTSDGDHRDVWDVLLDRSGALWISTVAGVFRHDGTRFVAFPLPVVGSKSASEFAPKMVYDIYEDRDGALWFGTDGAGVVKDDGTTMTVYTKAHDGLSSDRVCTIMQDRRGDFWFGTSDGGVSRYDGSTFTTHLRSATFSKHTGWGRYMAIHEDQAGNVWFGVSAAGGGVYRYDGESFRYFSGKDGLSDGGIPSISEDRSGNLWFGTTSGVFRLDGERFVPLEAALMGLP